MQLLQCPYELGRVLCGGKGGTRVALAVVAEWHRISLAATAWVFPTRACQAAQERVVIDLLDWPICHQNEALVD